MAGTSRQRPGIERVTRAAASLLDALGPSQREEAHLAVDDGRRTTWTYLPGERHGVALDRLDRRAAVAVRRLLAASVSHHVHAQVSAIMGLEDVLDVQQGGAGDRHAGDYWIAVYGDPGGPHWGWRIGGHHVSVHLTVAEGRARATPLFLGANPARVAIEDVVVSRPLAPEEDLGLALLGSLSDGQRARAHVSDRAPTDILTGDASRMPSLDTDEGVRLADLHGEAGALARRLVGLYLQRMAEPVRAAYEVDVLGDAWDQLRFVWCGASRPGTGHYYRLCGPRFLAELDNTQDGANHVHTVWRDPDGDFGRDLLADHLAGGAHRSQPGS